MDFREENKFIVIAEGEKNVVIKTRRQKEKKICCDRWNKNAGYFLCMVPNKQKNKNSFKKKNEYKLLRLGDQII